MDQIVYVMDTKTFYFFVQLIIVGNCAEIHLGVTGFNGRGGPFKFYKLGSAVAIATDKINSRADILGNYTITSVFEDSGCQEKPALDAIVTLVRDHTVDAIIGPACSNSGLGIGKLASQWNVPVVAYSGNSEELSDKTVYDTYSRTRSSAYAVGVVPAAVVSALDWSKTCLYYKAESQLPFLKRGVVDSLLDMNITITEPIFYMVKEETWREMTQTLAKIKLSCRGRWAFVDNLHIKFCKV